MFFIYFGCAFIASITVYFDSHKQNMPQWWGAVVFFAPITMPYYIIRTRQKKSLGHIAGFFLLCILVVIGEYFFYLRVKEKFIYSNYSPTIKEVLKFKDQLENSVKLLNKLTLKLETMNRIDSNSEKINEVMEFVSSMLTTIEQNEKAIKRFVLIINDYHDVLIKENFGWLLRIEEYYNQPVAIKYLKNLALYLNAFSELLKYTSDNLQKIRDGKRESLRQYDTYYMTYVKALESYGNIDLVRMKFQHNFMVRYPELEPYLPVIIDTRFFSILNQKEKKINK